MHRGFLRMLCANRSYSQIGFTRTVVFSSHGLRKQEKEERKDFAQAGKGRKEERKN
jgi:hypothetical protein